MYSDSRIYNYPNIIFVLIFLFFVVDHRIVLSIDQSRFRLVQNLDLTSKDATADDQKAKEEKRGWKRSIKLSNRKVHFVIQLIYNKKELIEIPVSCGFPYNIILIFNTQSWIHLTVSMMKGKKTLRSLKYIYLPESTKITK